MMSKETREDEDGGVGGGEEEEEAAAEPIGALYRVVCSFMGQGLSASRFGLIIIIAILSTPIVVVHISPKYTFIILCIYRCTYTICDGLLYIKSRAKWNQSPAKGFSSGRYYYVRAEYTIIIIIIIIYTHRIYTYIKVHTKGRVFIYLYPSPHFFFLYFFIVSTLRSLSMRITIKE